MVGTERQDDWNLEIPRVQIACDNSVSAATGLAPNEVLFCNLIKVHTSKIQCLLLTIFERSSISGHHEFSPRSAGILRPGDGPPPALARHRSRAYRSTYMLSQALANDMLLTNAKNHDSGQNITKREIFVHGSKHCVTFFVVVTFFVTPRDIDFSLFFLTLFFTSHDS